MSKTTSLNFECDVSPTSTGCAWTFPNRRIQLVCVGPGTGGPFSRESATVVLSPADARALAQMILAHVGEGA